MALLSAEDKPPRLKGACPDCGCIADGALTTPDVGGCVVAGGVEEGRVLDVLVDGACAALDVGIATSCAYMNRQQQIDRTKYIDFIRVKFS